MWTQKKIDALKIPSKYQELIKKMGYRYSGKKDVVEYLLLNKFGVVVMDMDMDMQHLKPLDNIIKKYDFLAAMEPGVCWGKIPVMTNSVIGSVSGNEIFLQTLDDAINKVDYYDNVHNSGVKYWFSKFRAFFNNERKIKVADPRDVLMQNFSSYFRKNNDFYKSSIAFPATYFNPIFPKQYKCYSWWNKIKLFF